MLTTLSCLPAGFFDTSARDLHRILPGPTLIHLPGRRGAPLLVSVLLHGNEDTGLKAAQRVLAAHASRELPRALSLLIGNVRAAALNERFLPDQPDYNRIWPGAANDGLPEHAMARDVVAQMRARGVFASLDIHNNTGLNPHYGCVNRIDARYLQLATLFSRLVVYTTRPLGTQSAAFSALCPAVTVECGKAGNPASEAHAAAFIEAALHLDHIPERVGSDHDLALYHTVAIAKVPAPVRFAFGEASEAADNEVWFESDLDHLNFQDLPVATRLARVAGGCAQPVVVHDESGQEVTDRYLEVQQGELRTRAAFMPAMLTLSVQAIRQDCLCYIMERLPHPT